MSLAGWHWGLARPLALALPTRCQSQASKPTAGPSAGVPGGGPWGIVRLPPPDSGKGRGTAWAGPRVPQVPPGLGQLLAPIPEQVPANPGPQGGSLLRDPVPLPGAPAASALTDPGEGHRQDPAPPGAPAPRGSGKGEGQGTRAKGGPNGTGRAALAGQNNFQVPWSYPPIGRLGGRRGPERDFARGGKGAECPGVLVRACRRRPGGVAVPSRPGLRPCALRSFAAAPLEPGLCRLLPAWAWGASLHLSLGKPLPPRDVDSLRWGPESRRLFTPLAFGCWCFPEISFHSRGFRYLQRADRSQITLASRDWSLELQGQLHRRHFQWVVPILMALLIFSNSYADLLLVACSPCVGKGIIHTVLPTRKLLSSF